MVRSRVTSNRRLQPYHHGDLRRAILDSAIASIAEDGLSSISLRELARRIGVSHAAPTHHFGDKAGLLTALAVEGYRLLAESLQECNDRTGSPLEVGIAYIRFALEHRAHFEVMFRPDLFHADSPEFVMASRATDEILYRAMDSVGQGDPSFDPHTAAIAAWSLAHGLATLYINGSLSMRFDGAPEDLARAAASYLFANRLVSPDQLNPR